MNITTRFTRIATTAVLALAGTMIALPGQAALQDQGNGLVFDDVTHLTWTQDANLFFTQYTANNAIINDIIALTPTITASDLTNPNGSNSGAAVDGGMTWFGAQAWINWLNAQKYGGFNDWRLPIVTPQQGNSFDLNDSYTGNSDTGYRIASPKSEHSYLFYVDLNNPPDVDTSGNPVTPVTGVCCGLINLGLFTNFKNNVYWYGTDNPNDATQEFAFAYQQGYQSAVTDKATTWAYAVPVRSDTAPPPTRVPGASPTPAPTPSATAGYAFNGPAACLGKVDKRGRKVKLIVDVQNQRTKKKPAAKLQVTVTQNGVTYIVKPKSRTVLLVPARHKKYAIAWRTKGAGAVTFTGTLIDSFNTSTATCTVLGATP